MKDIMTVALCTVKRYIKNPVAVTVLIAAPLLLFAFISGSKIDNFDVKAVSIPGGTSVVNHYVQRPDCLKMTDSESVIFMLMCIFYYAVVSFHSVYGDIKSGVQSRFSATPVGPLRGIIGKYLGNLFLCFAVSMVLSVLGKVLFGIELLLNPLITTAGMFFFSVIAVNLGLLLTGFIKNIYVCFVLVFCVNFSMVFPAMTNIFSPLTATPLFIVLKAYSMHDHMLTALSSQNLPSLALIFAVALVTTPPAILIGKRAME